PAPQARPQDHAPQEHDPEGDDPKESAPTEIATKDHDATQELFDVVVEATGSPDGFGVARCRVRPGGILVLKSTFAGKQPPLDLSSLVVDEVTVVGSRCGPFAPALRLLASGRVQVEPLVQGCYGLD